MSYQTGYTSEQIGKILRRANGIVTGTVSAEAVTNGHVNINLENVSGNPGDDLRAFASVRRNDYGSGGAVIPIISYTLTPTGDSLTIHLYGEGVKAGSTYTVDYLLI